MKRLQDLPIPERLCPQEKAIWGPLVRLLASRGHDAAYFAMVVELLCGAMVRTEIVCRQLRAAGLDPIETEAGRELLNHLERVAAECCLSLDDLAPILEWIPDESEHRTTVRRLRSELRQVETEIRSASPHSPEWTAALQRQGELHRSLVTHVLLAESDEERAVEVAELESSLSDRLGVLNEEIGGAGSEFERAELLEERRDIEDQLSRLRELKKRGAL